MESFQKLLSLQRNCARLVLPCRQMSSYPKMRRFENQTALVTGSTTGIGLATARRLASEGAYVVICSRKKENVEKALADLHKEGLKTVLGTVCDVTSEKERAELFKFVNEKRPGLDILVSNAGQIKYGSAIETTEEDYDYIMNINLKSHFLLTREFAPLMRKMGKGSIVYVSSLAGYMCMPQGGVYSISKIGLLQVTRLIASQLAADNIRVNCIAPGLIETDLSAPLKKNEGAFKQTVERIMLKRVGQPEEIAGIVGFLCSDDASYITSETIIASGGVQVRV